MTEDFSIRDSIRAVIRDTGDIDEQRVAEKVADSLTPTETAQALRQLLPAAVGGILRGSSRITVTQAAAIRTSQGLQPNHSMKFRAVRDLFAPDEGNIWIPGYGHKPLPDLTIADCEAAAAFRDLQAAANIHWANQLRILRDEMRRRRVRIVGDLPAAFVAEVWS